MRTEVIGGWADELCVGVLSGLLVRLARGVPVLAILLVLNSCKHQDQSQPCWIPPGGNNSNTFFYPRPSSIAIKEPTLELLWSSGFIPSKREDIHVHRTQYLSTGMSSGRMVLGVFREGISFFQDDGELISHHSVDGVTFGFLADVEGRGSSYAFVKTDAGIHLYDSRGNLQRRSQTQSIVKEMRVGKLDDIARFSLITAEEEPAPVPEGIKSLSDWSKRTVRCYDLQTLERKWEYRTGNPPHIAAIEDIDGDGYMEIICGTYSPENQVFWEDMVDTNGYVFALDHSGKRLWLQTFKGQFASIWPSVADLDGDGTMEIVVACGSWLRNWGGVYVLNAKDGSIVHRFPSDGDLDYSITAIGIADLDGDGKQEIICSSVGQHGGFFVLDHQCKPIGKGYNVSPSSMDFDFVVCRLGAINDIDGDGKLEIIGTTFLEKIIARDPRFSYSKLTAPQLLVLGSTLSPKISMALDEPPSEVIVGDLITGGANEIIVLADDISVYGVREARK